MKVALYLILVVIVDVGLGQVTICGHDNFDIQTLQRQNNWYGNINPQLCIGGFSGHNKACTLHFAVCQPLPPNVCGDGNNTGVCQIVVNSTGGTNNYDTGKIDFVVDKQSGTDGFQLRYQNGGFSTSSCNTTETLMFFECDKTAQWNVKNPNITGYINNDLQDGCNFITTIKYSGACIAQKPIDPNLCQLDTFDLQTLTDQPGWVATVPKDKCVPGTSEPYCDLMFSFCKHLPTGQCFNSVFCQPGENPVNFGQYNAHLKISKNDDDLGFTITNYNGTNTTQCPGGYFSTFVFICDSMARWNEITDYNITKFITAEPMLKDCEYIVRFNYSGACSEITPGPTSSSNKHVISIKEIGIIIGVGFILILVGVVLLYFGIGITIQAIRGKKGVELVPNYEIWKKWCCRKEKTTSYKKLQKIEE